MADGRVRGADARACVGSVFVVLVLCVSLAGCSIRKMAIKGFAGSFTSEASGSTFASDDDPELIREATPFALKTMETLLGELPEHRGLLLAACRGFTQYAYGFVQLDAALIEREDRAESERLRDRAIRLYLRARDYGLRGLELEHSGIGRALVLRPDSAVVDLETKDVPLVFWTGAAWGAAIGAGLDRPALVADLGAVNALMRRVLALDEGYDEGAIHEVMISLESVPEAMGGSRERARAHYERALELSGGKKAGTFVSFAASVSVAEQNRAEFEALLARALAIDPDEAPENRLQNLLAQKLARHLLARVDDLFLDDALDDLGGGLR